MNRNLLLTILLLILAGLAFYLYRTKSKANFLGTEYEMFAVQDTANVGRVFIADRSGNEALVERNGVYWTYSDKKTGRVYRASPEVVASVLSSIADLRVRRRVPLSAEANVVRELSGNSIKVEVYNRSKSIIKTYYLGLQPLNDDGNNAMVEGSEVPYVVFIPGFVGNLLPRFPVIDKFWRDEALFRVPVGDIKSVDVKYEEPNQRELSFRLEKAGSKFALNPIDGATAKMDESKLDEAFCANYIKGFDKVIAETIISDDPKRDSLLLASPLFCTITVNKTDGSTDVAKMYPIDYRGNKRPDGKVAPRQRMARYVVILNEGQDVYMIQHPAIERLLVAYPFFFKK